MLKLWRNKLKIRREIKRLHRQLVQASGNNDLTEFDNIWERWEKAKAQYNFFESARLITQAHKLGIDMPEDKKAIWLDEKFRMGLNERGLVGVKKLVDDEKFARRKRWVEVFVPIITALAGLVGTIMGLLAFLWSFRKCI